MDDFMEPLSQEHNGRDELEDILGDGEDIFNIETSEPQESQFQKSTLANKSDNLKDNSSIVTDDVVPSLCGENFDIEYLKMVKRIQAQYRLLPQLDIDAIYKEISELTVKVDKSGSLAQLGDEMMRVQAAKERLTEIVIEVQKVYAFKKRAIDILKDAWGKFTTEKNTEGRKGDAAFRLSNFSIDFATVESLMKACNHILNNLHSLQEILSRRITIFQLLAKIQEGGRTSLPERSFDRSIDDDELISELEGDKEEEDDKPKLQEF